MRLGLASTIALLLAAPLPALELQLAVEPAYAYEGEPVSIQVRVIDPESGLKPTLPAVPGLVIRGPGVSQQTVINNNRRVTTHVYSYEAQPAPGTPAGTLTIGPARITQRNGAEVQSNSVEIRIGKKPPPGIRFRCTLSPESGPPGAPFIIQYTVLYSGNLFTGDNDGFSFFNRGGGNPFGIAALDIPVLKVGGLSLKPARIFPDREATTVNYAEMPLHIQQAFEEDEKGQGWRALVFGFQATFAGTGRIAIPPAGVRLRLDTGKTQVVRDFFEGARRVSAPEDFDAQTEEVFYTARDLPAEGRPEGFTGALGRYAIAVTASPLDVATFAPITLEVRVTGDGILDALRPPAWSEVSSLTKDFDVSTDVDSGRIEGRAKIFRQVIRPRHARVTAIPPVPFPYFDPKTGRYGVSQSQPIPIRVSEVRTVGASDAIPSASQVSAPGKAALAAAPSIADRAGIGANFRDLGDVRPSLDPREEVLSGPFLALVGCPPLLLLAGVIAVRVLRKDPARKRRGSALARARSALAGAASPDEAARANQDYFRDRFDLGGGELGPSEVEPALRRRGVDSPLRSRAAAVLERLHASRFGGAGGDLDGLRSEAADVLRAIDAASGGAP
jgi:hypothetical protein